MAAGNGQISGFDNKTEQQDILKLSHAVAIALLISEFWFLLKLFPPTWFIDNVLLRRSLPFIPFLPALFPQVLV